MYYSVKELSPALQSALKAVSYGREDVEVEARESIEGTSWGDQGSRGFVTIVNLDTGKHETRVGSWGGPNMFESRLVDRTGDDMRIPIPPNGAVVKGTMGYPRTYCRIYAHPDAMGRMLPSAEPAEELTAEEQQAIYCFAAIKGGEYRRQELRYRKVSDATIDALVERGYLKRNRAGATAITTKGRNARTVKH